MATNTINTNATPATGGYSDAVQPVEHRSGEKAGFFSRLAARLVSASLGLALYRLDHSYPQVLSPSEKAELALEKARVDAYLIRTF